MKRRRLYMCVATLTSMCVFVTFFRIHATFAAPSDSPLPFIVEPIYPNNQQPDIRGYFELKATPGGHQEVQVRIINKNVTPLKVSISPADALTMINGGIQYTASSGSQNTHLLDPEFELGSHLTVPKVVTVAPKSQMRVPIDIAFPSSNVGTYLGGVIFSNDVAGKPVGHLDTNQKVTFTINSRFSMGMAVQLDMPKPAVPNFSFGDVTFATVPSGSQLLIQMRNAAPAVLRDLQGSFDVANTKGLVAIKGQFGPFTMAPQSEIQYPVLWNNQLSPGTYTVHLNATYQAHQVRQERTFSIGFKQMSQYQTVTGRTPLPFQIPRWFWVLVGVALGSLVFLGYWLGARSKRRLIAEFERKGRAEHDD